MRHLAKYLLIAALTMSSGNLFAQLHGQALIDSLLKELPRQKEDTNKVILLNGLSLAYSNTNPDSGIICGQQGLALATRLVWQKGIADADNKLGTNYWRLSDIEKALDYDFKALKIEEILGDQDGIANTLTNIGNAYASRSDYQKALEYFLKALKISERTGNIKMKAKNLHNTGLMYSTLGNYPKALEYDFRALKINEKSGNKASAASDYANIGGIYDALNDHTKALEYYFNALKVYEDEGNMQGIARNTCNIGAVYYEIKDYSKALEYYYKSLKTAEELGNEYGISLLTGNIGNVYSDQKNYTQAIAWYFREFEVSKRIGNVDGIAAAYGNMGVDYSSMAIQPAYNNEVKMTSGLPSAPSLPDSLMPRGKKRLLCKAVECLKKAIAIDEETGNLEDLQYNYQNLSVAASRQGNYEAALDAHVLYAQYHDSLFSRDNARKIVEQQMKFQYEKKEDFIKLANAKKEEKAAIRLQKQRSYTVMGVGGILALLGFSFFMFRNNKLLGKEKKRSDDLLLNILPAEVASELKEKNSADAKQFDNVTVLFTDFVNFTQTSENMSAQALIDELHTCFKAFDEITAKYRVEKIKTIGDAYLAVAGLPSPDPVHAEHIVQATIEIHSFMEQRYARLGDHTFRIRIGIHSGSVVAGIVGVKKFAYDIWGDTVNTAARMEQNSEPGSINISEATYKLVKDKYPCDYRGEIDVKGKGMMKMYYIRHA